MFIYIFSHMCLQLSRYTVLKKHVHSCARLLVIVLWFCLDVHESIKMQALTTVDNLLFIRTAHLSRLVGCQCGWGRVRKHCWALSLNAEHCRALGPLSSWLPEVEHVNPWQELGVLIAAAHSTQTIPNDDHADHGTWLSHWWHNYPATILLVEIQLPSAGQDCASFIIASCIPAIRALYTDLMAHTEN